MPDPISPQSRRVALVIGIGAYTHARPLNGPPGDAALMANMLTGMGFRVLPALNADYNTFRDKLREFHEHLRGADIGLLYFSGHGVQDATRENYLLPTDADLNEPEDLGRLAFSLRRIMADMHERVETGLIFLDACRDNPFDGQDTPLTKSVLASGGGLAKPKGSLGGLLVAYASDEGNVALDGQPSPFTAALLRHLPSPGRPVTSTLIDVRRDVQTATKGRQMPWTQDSLKQEIVLVAGAAGAQPVPPPEPEPPGQPVAGVLDLPPGILDRPKPLRFLFAPVLLLTLGLGYGLYRAQQDAEPEPPVIIVDVPPSDPEPAACTGLSWAKEMACRVPDLNNADDNIRLVAAKEMEHALGDVSLSTADKAGIVAALLDLAEIKSMAAMSQDGRSNVLGRLSSIPAELWLDPALIGQLERAHRTIAALDADTTALLGNQTLAFVKSWKANTGYRLRADIAVYPQFAGFTQDSEWLALLNVISSTWGWTFQGSERTTKAVGIAQVRYGPDTMLPLALLLAGQLNGQVVPDSGDASSDGAVLKAIAAARLRRVEVAQVRMKDNQLEIWIGK